MMSNDNIWKEKLAQIFHDPFIKAYCQGKVAKEISRKLGSTIDFSEGKDRYDNDIDAEETIEKWVQDSITAMFSKHLLGKEILFPYKYRNLGQGEKLEVILDAEKILADLRPDLASSGADRPVLGNYHQNHVIFWNASQDQNTNHNEVIVTHPLDNSHLKIPAPADVESLWEKLKPSINILKEYGIKLSSNNRYKDAFYYMWRLLPEDLSKLDGHFWPLQPADTRCPDHSIWDHLRVSSSLYFIPKSSTADARVQAANPGRRPWLMSLWVGPARDYVGQSRTGRDLWTGSMMLSELAWSMLEPIVEKFGADNIIYPDLRANLRCDLWLKNKKIVMSDQNITGTLASLIPNRIVAVVPEKSVEDFGSRCITSVKNRWKQMVKDVRKYLLDPKRLGEGPWIEIFDSQTSQGPFVNWTAVAWKWDGYHGKFKPDDIHLPPVLPFQDNPDGLPKSVKKIEENRKERFKEWIDTKTWDHYQSARYTFMKTYPGHLFGQRGFDYSLTHHKLLALHGARKNIGNTLTENEKPGDKCTLCGARQALTNNSEGPVGRQRDEATRLWRNLDPEHIGHERLCGICAVRRYLSDSGDRIKTNWLATSFADANKSGPQIPFPSTGLIAAQDWLYKIWEKYDLNDKSIKSVVQDIVYNFSQTGIKKTQFVGSLTRFRKMLAECHDNLLRSFLEIEIQYLNPEYWKPQNFVDPRLHETYEKMGKCCAKLYQIAGFPETHIAIIKLDGDQMGRLILGAPDRIGATWRDVLHPDAVKSIISDEKKGKPIPAWKRSWRTLLGEQRLMGPSIHAFISRALREFSNRVLPWVVEQHYPGRLIYAGGDDALILCRAQDAIGLLKKLNEIYTSAWVNDNQPEASPWKINQPDSSLYEIGSRLSKERFQTHVNNLENCSGY
ncbi:type III-B CRISPR-associated protein Cas10/Cmr2, partial [bacterium]|nr:type III-B CRISPR-associated protein Cas10/Cmr2 [bacterium]